MFPIAVGDGGGGGWFDGLGESSWFGEPRVATGDGGLLTGDSGGLVKATTKVRSSAWEL